MDIAAPAATARNTVESRPPLSWGLRLLALVGALILAGCAGDVEPPPPPTVIVTQITAVDSLNPDSQGRASPLVVRLYELSAAAPFDTADFFDIYDQDRATLGETLVAMDEIRVLPDESKSMTRTLEPRTRFIGVVAAFREVEVSTWRGLAEVPLNRTTPYDLSLGSLSVTIKPAAQ